MKQPTTKIFCSVTNDLNHDQRMQRICNSLHGLGYEVTLIGRIRDNSSSLMKQDYQQKRIHCIFNKGFLFYAEYNIRLFIFLLFSNFDIVCSVDLDTLSAGVLAAKLKHKKCVYDAHEYFPESPELMKKPKVQWFWQKFEKKFLPQADAVYTVSDGIQQIFETKYLIKVSVIRNLPPLDMLETKAIFSNYIIYQGALNVGRGLEALIQCMPEINAELWLAGDGDIAEELKQLAQNTAPNKIKFLGKLAPDELKIITQNAILGINLLEPMGESYYRSLSNKFFDYMMAEIPQVCINFPEYAAIIKEYEFALLVDNLEKSILVKAIDRIINDKVYREFLIEECRKAKVNLNWEKETLKLKDIYQALE